MHITSIEVENLHKAISANLQFHSDLGIIVGINGSGKTSIINITAQILRLNIAEVLRIHFRRVAILGKTSIGQSVSIVAVKSKDSFSIRVKKANRKVGEYVCPLPPIPPSTERPDERAAWERYLRRATADIALNPLTKFIRDNVKLTLVTLDRTLFAEDYEGALAIDLGLAHRTIRRQADDIDPISQVEHATRTRYSEYRNQLKKLTEELNSKLILQLFQATDIFAKKGLRHFNIPDMNDIKRLENSIGKSSFYPKNRAEQNEIAAYFRITKRLARDFARAPELLEKDSGIWFQRFYASALERFARLNKLAKEFSHYDDLVKNAFVGVKKYLDAINSFLLESHKVALFSDLDNTLRFRLPNDPEGVERPINDLSSGEKQIVTVLAYLAYIAGENSIFIIDEPELSLHVSWQKRLLAELTALQPAGCQMILATHSPEIVGHHRDRVVRLVPKYKNSD